MVGLARRGGSEFEFRGVEDFDDVCGLEDYGFGWKTGRCGLGYNFGGKRGERKRVGGIRLGFAFVYLLAAILFSATLLLLLFHSFESLKSLSSAARFDMAEITA